MNLTMILHSLIIEMMYPEQIRKIETVAVNEFLLHNLDTHCVQNVGERLYIPCLSWIPHRIARDGRKILHFR